MCKQHALRIAWTIARSIAFLDFRVLRWKFTYDWKCVNTTYHVPLFCPLPASRKGLRLTLRSALFGEGGRDWRPWNSIKGRPWSDFFLCPQRNFGRHIVMALSIRQSVRQSIPLSCPVHISYILWGRNSKFGVWIHLGMEECRVPFWGHCDLDLWPSF